MIWKYKDT